MTCSDSFRVSDRLRREMNLEEESVRISSCILEYAIHILMQINVDVLKSIVNILSKNHVLLNLISAVQLHDSP